MVAMRLMKSQAKVPAGKVERGVRGGLGWTLEAWPVDAWMRNRIEPAVEMNVEEMKDGGMAVQSREPLMPGRRVSLSFPDSPFLPRPGTVARVDACVRGPGGYRVELSFEGNVAA